MGIDKEPLLSENIQEQNVPLEEVVDFKDTLPPGQVLYAAPQQYYYPPQQPIQNGQIPQPYIVANPSQNKNQFNLTPVHHTVIVQEIPPQPIIDSQHLVPTIIIFIVGFFIPLIWLIGFAFIRSKNQGARYLAIASVTLFFLLIFLVIIITASSPN